MRSFATVIGASGFIGHAIYQCLKKHFPDDNIRGTYFSNSNDPELEYLDIRDESSIEDYLQKYHPRYLFLLAGSKNLQKCEQDYNFALKINTFPVGAILRIIKCCKLSTRLLFFSTDYVFDGTHGSYKESDLPNPKTNYGKSNYEAEKLLLASDSSYNIIRTSAVMGQGSRFYDWLRSELKNEEEVEMFKDVNFTPTPLELVCRTSLKVLQDIELLRENKIIHLVGAEHYSRYSFACEMKKELKNNSCETIIPIKAPDIFQKNLTMKQSSFINKICNYSMRDFFKEELNND